MIDLAINYYDKAIKLNPNYSRAYFHKGNLLMKLNFLEEAIECFNKVNQLDSIYNKAFNNKGTILLQLKNYNEALESFNNIILLFKSLL